jgi:hypothetical protein
MTIRFPLRALASAVALLAGMAVSMDSAAQSARGLDARAQAVIEHWTPARVAAAIPRDFAIDPRGLAYLRLPNGGLVPYGHNITAMKPPAGGGSTTGSKVRMAEWTRGGVVQTAAGRIIFEMPATADLSGAWDAYVCSGTVVNDGDGASDRSLILTAGHCVYDDVNKTFARNVLFIPNQDATTGTRTDFACGNDPYGCWVPKFGVVDTKWTDKTFPANVMWDYAFYVVDNAAAHSPGYLADVSNVLDAAVGSMNISFAGPPLVLTHALGYSYDRDPNFMYCADTLVSRDAANWWLAGCGLSGGSSGGPWVDPMDLTKGNGPVMSVNSWGYTHGAGMAGPKFSGSSTAQCVFNTAKGTSINGTAGVANNCPQ